MSPLRHRDSPTYAGLSTGRLRIIRIRGQIVYVARHFAGSNWRTLTVPKKKSGEFNAQVASGDKSQL
jgi:hypothetical protein